MPGALKHSINTSSDSQEPAWEVSKPRLTLRHAGTASHCHSCPNPRVFGIRIVPIPWTDSCFLYLSNHSRHAQTPTMCCQRHLTLRNGGMRSSISGWENTVLLTLQRQGGQEKKKNSKWSFSPKQNRRSNSTNLCSCRGRYMLLQREVCALQPRSSRALLTHFRAVSFLPLQPQIQH